MMKSTNVSWWCGIIFILLGLVGCVTTERIFVPSPIVLNQYATIGIIEISSNDPTINQYATELFQEYVQGAQPGVPILRLGTQGQVLASIGSNQLDAKAIQKIGEAYKVNSVFIGGLVYSNVKTDFDISQALNLNASVKTYIEATLTARLNLTSNGATIWSNSSTYKRTLSKVHVGRFGSSFNINDAEAHKKLLPDMVNEITCDFRGRYIRQRIRN